MRGYQDPRPVEKRKEVGGRVVAKHWEKRSKEKDWMGWNLLYWCNQHALSLEEEYRFHPDRKWRSDWAIPGIRVLIEYEGLMSEKSRHTSVKGYSGDSDKYREAAKAGWVVLRYTALNYKQVLKDLEDIVKNQHQ